MISTWPKKTLNELGFYMVETPIKDGVAYVIVRKSNDTHAAILLESQIGAWIQGFKCGKTEVEKNKTD